MKENIYNNIDEFNDDIQKRRFKNDITKEEKVDNITLPIKSKDESEANNILFKEYREYKEKEKEDNEDATYNEDINYKKNKGKFSFMPKLNFKITAVASILILFIILFQSFYFVSPSYKAVVFRLGSYHKTNTSGIYFKLPFFDKVKKINTENIRREEYGYITTDDKDDNDQFIYEENEQTVLESNMLTFDSKIVDVDFVAQFQIIDPYKFIVNLPKDEEIRIHTIRNITESCFREIVAKSMLDDILTSGKEEIQMQSKELMQKRFNKIDSGIRIISVQIQDVDPPGPVKKAFDNVNTAKANKEKRILEAQQYKNEKLADAEGEVQKILNDAKSYSARRTSVVEGDYNRIHQLAIAYRENPELVKSTLYLDAAEEFWPKAKITIIDVGNNVNLMNIDKLISKGGN